MNAENEIINFADDEWQFKHLNFEKKEWLDKDGKDDEYYTLKYVQYEKAISDNSAIEFCYAYKTEDGSNYKLFETTCELRIGTEYLKLNLDKVHKIRSLYKLITGTNLHG